MSVLKENAQVIMLPVNKSKLALFENNKLSWTPEKDHYYETGEYGIKSQHLYIVSDEEIKEGDWFICGNEVHKCTGVYSLKVTSYIKCKKGDCSVEICKKIIATTDTSLMITIGSNLVDEETNTYTEVIDSLPNPSQGFIEKYINEYNKGNVITDILVEYETIKNPNFNRNKGVCSFNPTYLKQLKISKDNTITIHPIKDTWNREEVEILCRNAFSAGEDVGITSSCNNVFDEKYKVTGINEWLAENL